MLATFTAEPSEPLAAEHEAVYGRELRQLVKQYYKAANLQQFWRGWDFEYVWRKFQRGVRQELELARMASHWVDLKNARVLVIGSYLGTEAVAYALHGASVVGLELDREAMAVSVELAKHHGVEIEFYARDACRSGFDDGSFDYVSCAQVLEHLPPAGQPAMLHEIWRLCKPGGYFWIDTPNQLRWLDQHDTGLPFIHWLPRPLKVPLARALGRAVTICEPALGDTPVYLHYYLNYFKLKHILAGFGPFEIVSKYRGYADMDHYVAQRELQGRDGGWTFALKTRFRRQALKVWDWNWFSSTRVMIHKLSELDPFDMGKTC